MCVSQSSSNERDDLNLGSFAHGRPNPYRDPELAQWMGSFEGVPETTTRHQFMSADDGVLANALRWMAVVAPGLMLAGGVTIIGYALAWLMRGVVSPVLVAVAMGLCVAGAVKLPSAYAPGLRWAMRTVLRVGIVLLGLRLSLTAVGAIGLVALPIVLTCIVAALLTVLGLARWLGVPRRLAALIAVGTGICGVSAVIAMAPAIKAEEEEVGYAAACVTLFGLAGLLAYPFASHWLFAGEAQAVGLFLGTAIHDTSHVAGAALAYEQRHAAPLALEAATVTKLLRNLALVVVVPLMAFLMHRGAHASAARPPLSQLVPLFVVGFVAAAGLRTLGDATFAGNENWQAVLSYTGTLSAICLAFAMASLGLSTQWRRLWQLGLRPMALGLLAAAAVGTVSYLMITFTEAMR